MKEINAEVSSGNSPHAGRDEVVPLQFGKEVKSMKVLNGISSWICCRREPGQTMTEYVLIIAAIAVAGYTAYLGLEGGIQGIITSVTTTLSAA
jgi:Flp pilus assembly pilin Flp